MSTRNTPLRRPVRRPRGFSLAEVMVATAIFAIVIVAAFQLYDQSSRQYRLGEAAADAQQNVRIGFEQLIADLRLTGYDVDRTGTGQGHSIDEKIEGVWRRAIAIRGNFNSKDGDVTGARVEKGRETAYEGATGVITTANPEIVIYALRSKATASGSNPSSITVQLDATKPRNAALSGSTLSGVETVTLSGIDLTGTHPPYELIKTWLPDSSSSTLVAPVVVADNVLDMNFTYLTGSGQILESSPSTGLVTNVSNANDYTSVAANLLPATGTGTATAFTAPARSIRSAISMIRVNVTALSAFDDPDYVVPGATSATLLPKRRRYPLEADALLRNIQMQGEQDSAGVAPNPPTSVAGCGGHCSGLYVKWAVSTSSDVVSYRVWYGASVGARTYSIDVPGASSTSIYQSGIAPGTYYVGVQAVNLYGQTSSVADDSTALTVVNAANDAYPPSAVTSLTAVASNQGTTGTVNQNVLVDWTAPTTVKGTITCDLSAGTTPYRDPGGYRLYRRLWDGGCSTSVPSGYGDFRVQTSSTTGLDTYLDPGVERLADEAVLGPTATQYLDETVPACAPAFYRVVPVDLCGKFPTDSSGNVELSPAMTSDVQASVDASVYPLPPIGLKHLTSPSPVFAPPSAIGVYFNWNPSSSDSATPPHLRKYTRYQLEMTMLPALAGDVPTIYDFCEKPSSPACTAGTGCLIRNADGTLTARLTATGRTGMSQMEVRVRAVESCSPTAANDASWSAAVTYPPCGTNQKNIVTGSIGGAYGTMATTPSTLYGNTLSLRVDATSYTLGTPAKSVTAVDPGPLYDSSGAPVAGKVWLPDGTNPTSCAAGQASCMYGFTMGTSGLVDGAQYSTEYTARTSACDDPVVINPLYWSLVTGCQLRTMSNDCVNVGTSAFPTPTAALSGTSYKVVTMPLALSSTSAASRIRIDKVALQWDAKSDSEAVTYSTQTLLRVKNIDFIDPSGVETPCFADANGLAILERSNASTTTNVTKFTCSTPYTFPATASTYGTHFVRFTFRDTFGAKLTVGLGSHVGLYGSFEYSSLDSSGNAFNTVQYCVADPGTRYHPRTEVLSDCNSTPAGTFPWDLYWRGCRFDGTNPCN